MMTDIPDLIRVSVASLLGNSDHSSISAVISMTRAVFLTCDKIKVFLKGRANWNTVCGPVGDLLNETFRLLTILLRS